MSKRIRTFVAVNVSPGVRHAIGRELPKLTEAAPHFNWTKPENYHFTLSFLGDVPDPEIPDICKEIGKAVSAIEEFEVEVVGLSAFPSPARIRYVWAGVGSGRDELCQLQAAVADAAQRMGFPRDHETYTPHLTVARAARDSGGSIDALTILDPLADRSFGVCSIDEVIVYASYRERQGPTYVPMSTVSLAY